MRFHHVLFAVLGIASCWICSAAPAQADDKPWVVRRRHVVETPGAVGATERPIVETVARESYFDILMGRNSSLPDVHDQDLETLLPLPQVDNPFHRTVREIVKEVCNFLESEHQTGLVVGPFSGPPLTNGGAVIIDSIKSQLPAGIDTHPRAGGFGLAGTYRVTRNTISGQYYLVIESAIIDSLGETWQEIKSFVPLGDSPPSVTALLQQSYSSLDTAAQYLAIEAAQVGHDQELDSIAAVPFLGPPRNSGGSIIAAAINGHRPPGKTSPLQGPQIEGKYRVGTDEVSGFKLAVIQSEIVDWSGERIHQLPTVLVTNLSSLPTTPIPPVKW